MKENRVLNDYKPFRQLRSVGLMQRLADVLDKSDCEILDYYVIHGLSIENICQIFVDKIAWNQILYSPVCLLRENYIKERLEYINNVLLDMKGVNLQNALTVDDLREFLKKPETLETKNKVKKHVS